LWVKLFHENYCGEVFMAQIDRIELDPRVCNGKAVIQGTRIPVSVILEQIASGESWDSIIRGYPEISKEDIQAALLYASAQIDHSEVKEAHA
jgi:uncharacterized protein (DUF433 family)